MRWVVLVWLAMTQAAVAGPCEDQRAFLLNDLLKIRQNQIIAPGVLTGAPGQCTLEGLVVDRGATRGEIGRITTQWNGVAEPLKGLGSQATFDIEFQRLRTIPSTGRGWQDYLLEVLNRESFIEGQLSVQWSAADKSLTLDRFELEFRDGSTISLTLGLAAVADDPVARPLRALGPSRLQASHLVIVNNGHLDAMLLPALLPTLEKMGGNPDVVVPKFRSEVRRGFEQMPADAVSRQSRDAVGRLIDAFPAMHGRLEVSLTSGDGLLVAPIVALQGKRRQPDTDALARAFGGAQIEIVYDRAGTR